MFEWLSMARILHVIAAVFMAAPLYMLIVVGERGAFGRRIDAAMDGYMERIVSGQPRRCYAYVAVLFFTGLALLILTGQGLAPVVTNWTVALKVVRPEVMDDPQAALDVELKRGIAEPASGEEALDQMRDGHVVMPRPEARRETPPEDDARRSGAARVVVPAPNMAAKAARTLALLTSTSPAPVSVW